MHSPKLACFYSATLAWNPTAIDTAERRAWREWLIANHVPTYPGEGEAEAEQQLAEFEARFVTLYADPALQARPIADDQGIFGGYTESLDTNRDKNERPKN